MTRLAALFLLLLTFIQCAPAHAISMEPQTYRRAFAAMDAGHADLAYASVQHAHDAVLNKVFRAYYMAAPGNNASFAEMADFVTDNPDWPGLKDIRMIAEQKMPDQMAPMQVVDWFGVYPPVTLIGAYRYIDALNASGHGKEAQDFIRQRWINGDFRDDEFTAYYTRFGAYLSSDDHWARLDRLLWEGSSDGAHRMYGLVDSNAKILAEARMALAREKPHAFDIALQVPSERQSDPGLQFEKLRWLRRQGQDDMATEILEHAPSELGKPDAWWEERQIMVRRAMDRRDYELAYRLAGDHGAVNNKNLLQAEFLCGWLALRFLNRPDEARDHFEALYDHATTPISRARGAYWLGRSYETLNDGSAAQEIYQIASSLNITYYGQLAAARLSSDPVITAEPEPPIPSPVRAAFYARDIVRVIEHLHDLGGQSTRVRIFFKAATDAAVKRADFVLLTELAYRLSRPDLAIEAAKAADQKNMLVAAGGFPLLGGHIPSPPEPAFTHAVIRQESMFNPDASSPVGAKGLMQLMTPTAKSMAQHLGMKYRQQKLCEPEYNLKLGTAFIQNQINSFDGSYVLALAGYNAGPSRVREWMTQIGDPRDPHVDPVDWIEMVPSPETRNYIQRILENLQIYRARLNGGEAQLLILKDLRR